jgi:S-adenosylmethionine decarboxylase proenzyme
MNTALGRHLLAELYNCNPDRLRNASEVEQTMNQAALACGATIVQSAFHQFSPFGVSGVVVIAESHLAIHTWPEYGYASVDLYTCGDTIDPMLAYRFLKAEFDAKAGEVQQIKRGHMEVIRKQSPVRMMPPQAMLQKGGRS